MHVTAIMINDSENVLNHLLLVVVSLLILSSNCNLDNLFCYLPCCSL